MKRLLTIPFLMTLVAVLSGCQNMGSSSAGASESEQIRELKRQRIYDARKLQTLQNQMITLNKKVINYEKYYDEESAKYKSSLSTLQNGYNKLVAKINSLQNTLSACQQAIAAKDNEIAALKKQIVAEQEARKKDMQAMMDKVAAQTTASINRLIEAQNKARAAQAANTSPDQPVGKGEFIIHTVGKGHTLSAIAGAYNVTVEDIKKANRLKSSMIRVGQKLYIPKKK